LYRPGAIKLNFSFGKSSFSLEKDGNGTAVVDLIMRLTTGRHV